MTKFGDSAGDSKFSETGDKVLLGKSKIETGETTDLSRLRSSMGVTWGASITGDSNDQRPVV